MPKVNIPGVGKVNFPDDMSHNEIVNAIENEVMPQYKQHLEKTGFSAATSSGFHSAKGAAEKYLGELTGSETLKRYGEENKAKARAEFEPTTEQDVANAQGILPTVGKYLSRKVTEPVGGILGGYGVPIAAAAATPFVAPAGLGTAGVAALSAGVGTLAGLPSMAGETLERQEALGQKPDLVNATASGLFKSALMNITIPGMGVATKGISKALGNSLEAQAQGMAQKVINGELSHEAAVKSLSGYGQQLARNMAVNATAGSAMMVGSEAADRLATGESLTSPEAMEAYGHNIRAAVELSPIFGALHGLGERGRAKTKLADAKDRNETINQINADRAQRNLDITNIKEDARAQAEAAFRAADEAQRATIRAQIKENPNRPIEDIINEVTGVYRKPTANNIDDYFKAHNEPSGRFVSDPATGHEYELTMGEFYRQQRPDLFPEPPAPELTKQDILPLQSSIEQAREVQTQGEPQQDLFNPIDLPPLPNAPEFKVPGIVTPEVIPTQQLIEQNLGIGAKRYKTNEANVEEAFNEPTGARVQKEGQIERPETEEDMLIRNYPEAFAEAPLTSLPLLDDATLSSMGFTSGKGGYTPLLKYGKDPIKNADKINDLFDTHLKSNKTLNKDVIAEYRSKLDAYRQAQGPEVSAESRATGAADQSSVSVPKPRGQRATKGAAGAIPTNVGDVGVLAGELGAGAKGKPAPLKSKPVKTTERPTRLADADQNTTEQYAERVFQLSKGREKEIGDYFVTPSESAGKDIKEIHAVIDELLRNNNTLPETKNKLKGLQQSTLKVEEAPVTKATLKAHDDALEKAYDLRLGEVNRNQVKSFADRLVRHGIIDAKQRETYANMLRDKNTEAEDILSELETDVEINKERLQKGPKVESAKSGSKSKAPEGVPQHIWDLHEKVMEYDNPNFEFLNASRGNDHVTTGEKERRRTVAYKKLKNAIVAEYPELKDTSYLYMSNLMDESSRREEARGRTESAKAGRDLTTVEGVTADGIDRLAEGYKKHGPTGEYQYSGRSYAAINKIEDGIEERLKAIGLSSSEAHSAVWKMKNPAEERYKEFLNKLRGETEQSRGRTEGGHTAESLRSELTKEFGEQGIRSLEKRGILNLHDTVERSPEHIRNAVESDAIGAHSEGVTHLFADRIAKGEGRRGLLHEVGEHYGLKGMLGERIYNNVLDTIAKNARKDPVIKEAIDHVARNYPELRDNPGQFAREVVARIGESAPTHTVYRRIVAGVKNFLVKMGLMKNLNARDVQDLVQHSLRTAMKRDIVAPKQGVEAARRIKELAGLTIDRLRTLVSSYSDSYKTNMTHGAVVYMSPEEFLNLTASREGQSEIASKVKTNYYDIGREKQFDLSTLKGLEEYIGKDKHDTIRLRVEPDAAYSHLASTLNVRDHEGRHRMTALKNAGINRVPVVLDFGSHWAASENIVNRDYKLNPQSNGVKGTVIKDVIPLSRDHIDALKSKYLGTGDIEFAKKGGPAKRLDGSPLKQPKPYTGRMPESIKRVIDGEGSMWENLGRQLGAFKNKVGTAVVSKAYNIERKALDKGIAGVSSKQQGELRGDRIYQQAQSASALSHSGMQMGGLRLMPSGLVEAFADKENPANMVMIADGFNKLVARAAKEVGNEDTAHDMLSMAWVGPRYENIIANNERIDRAIDSLRSEKPEGYGAVVEQLQSQKKYVGDWTKEDRAAAREGEKRYGKELADIRKTWNTMRGRLLNFMVETQNMTRELAEEYIDNIDYVPFYRIPAEELVDTNFRPLTGSSLQNAGRQYRFKGSDKTQADPITNMMANVSWMMQKGIQNNAALRLAKLEEQLGEGRWVDAENPAVKGRTVTIYKEGKPKEFILDDVNDMAAFGGNPILQGMVWDVARGFTSFLRHGVTMFPQFVWNQAWEDPIRATFVSGNKAGFASNIANTWKSIYKNQISAEHTAGAEALYRSGVIGQKDVMSERDVERRFSGADKSGFRKSLFFFERLAQGSDLGARESVYNNAMKELKAEGYDEATAHAVATSRAIQYMPHQQVGNSRTMAYLRAMMPFVNSPIQGYARDIAAARGRIDGVSKEQGQQMLLLRLAKYAAFIGAYAAFRSGDPDYESYTADQRDNNFYIAGTKIPAPQEFRSFKAAIERGTRAYILSAPGADLEGADIAAAVLRKNWELVAGLALPVPTAIRPVLEGVTNYNIRTGRPLVGQGLQDREPALQYNDNTSEIGKLMGSIMNVSPIKVDNFISGYGGYLGQTVEKFSNTLVAGRPTQSVNDWLFVGSLLEPEYGGGPRTETYELADKLARVKSTMKALKDEGRIDELKEYIQKNRGYIGGEESISRAHQAVTNIRRYQSQVNASSMDPDAKRAKINELKQNELDALARVHELHRKIVEANNS